MNKRENPAANLRVLQSLLVASLLIENFDTFDSLNLTWLCNLFGRTLSLIHLFFC
jgi:hypothetical protein